MGRAEAAQRAGVGVSSLRVSVTFRARSMGLVQHHVVEGIEGAASMCQVLLIVITLRIPPRVECIRLRGRHGQPGVHAYAHIHRRTRRAS